MFRTLSKGIKSDEATRMEFALVHLWVHNTPVRSPLKLSSPSRPRLLGSPSSTERCVLQDLDLAVYEARQNQSSENAFWSKYKMSDLGTLFLHKTGLN